jgi:mannosyltransferase OCH1-like enzyme
MSLKTILIPRLNRPPQRSIVSEIPGGAAIPRIIHQTFYDRTLPPELQASTEALRARNPGWEYRFYDDADIADFIATAYGERMLACFDRIDARYGATRADLFRYLLMYKVGGVYLDIKSSATLPLDSVLRPDDRYLLSNWSDTEDPSATWGRHYDLESVPGGEFQQWYIACAPGHPYMKAVIDTVLANIERYDPSLHGVAKNGALRTAGPIPYTLAIHRILDQHPHRRADSRTELGFEYNVYRNQSHQTTFRAHYSTQTASIVRLTPVKQGLNLVYGALQYVHDRRMASQRRRPSAH